MGKIDTDLDFRHEQWKGRGNIGENVRKQEKLQDYGEMQRNILCRCSWLDVVCADVVDRSLLPIGPENSWSVLSVTVGGPSLNVRKDNPCKSA